MTYHESSFEMNKMKKQYVVEVHFLVPNKIEDMVWYKDPITLNFHYDYDDIIRYRQCVSIFVKIIFFRYELIRILLKKMYDN